MPTHDPMYTASLAEELRKSVKDNPALKRRLTIVENEALEASSAGAKVAVKMFDALHVAMASDDPVLAAKAKKIHDGPFNSIVA